MSVPDSTLSRSGVLAAGNFIVDHVKLIDVWPGEEMLATILSGQTSNGGGAYNILVDLARMAAPFPLEAAGLLGDDSAGDWIVAHCQALNIGTAQLAPQPGLSTSYTDAFTVTSTGRRTFLHHRGANASLSQTHIDLTASRARIFYLGYLMLLDRLDALLPDGRSAASHLLQTACQAGFLTVVDMVSIADPTLIPGTLTALPWIDHFVLNEIEASQLSGIPVRLPDKTPDIPALRRAARKLLDHGVRASVTIHCVEGAISMTRTTENWQSSVALHPHTIKGATGAGDAFAAGWIYALHENLSPQAGLQLGVAAAAACLSDPTPSGGLRPVDECLEIARLHGFREPISDNPS